MIRYVLLATFATFAAFLIGLAGGLLYGLIIDPIEYIDVDPIDLSQEVKHDYARMIAAIYLADRDLGAAHQRLALLGYSPNDVAQATRRAALEKSSSTPALAQLSLDLGVEDQTLERLLATATPTPTATPTHTPPPTATALPTATPSPTPSPTLEPTATPAPPPPVATTAPPAPTRPPAAPPTEVPPIIPSSQGKLLPAPRHHGWLRPGAPICAEGRCAL